MSKVRGYVEDLNANPDQLVQGQRGPCSKYELPEEQLKGRLELKFFDNIGKGVRAGRMLGGAVQESYIAGGCMDL
jgi:acetylornithine deacetylase